MAYMKIHCDYCGGSWEVYERDNWFDQKIATCPHCATKIDEETWKGFVLPAFGSFVDANQRLFRDHVDDHRACIQFDLISDILFKNRHEQQA